MYNSYDETLKREALEDYNTVSGASTSPVPLIEPVESISWPNIEKATEKMLSLIDFNFEGNLHRGVDYYKTMASQEKSTPTKLLEEGDFIFSKNLTKVLEAAVDQSSREKLLVDAHHKKNQSLSDIEVYQAVNSVQTLGKGSFSSLSTDFKYTPSDEQLKSVLDQKDLSVLQIVQVFKLLKVENPTDKFKELVSPEAIKGVENIHQKLNNQDKDPGLSR